MNKYKARGIFYYLFLFCTYAHTYHIIWTSRDCFIWRKRKKTEFCNLQLTALVNSIFFFFLKTTWKWRRNYDIYSGKMISKINVWTDEQVTRYEKSSKHVMKFVRLHESIIWKMFSSAFFDYFFFSFDFHFITFHHFCGSIVLCVTKNVGVSFYSFNVKALIRIFQYARCFKLKIIDGISSRIRCNKF